jgi:hypothetical protein
MKNLIRLLVFIFLGFQSTFYSQAQKLNHTQIIGSHNSYKSGMPPQVLEYLKKINPAAAASLEYQHLPLSEQLDLGLRNLELDVFHDPMGGKYANPKSLSMLPEGTIFDPKVFAATSRVKSSVVGPKPPETITTSEREMASARAREISAGSSVTTDDLLILRPRDLSFKAKR